MDSPGSSQMSMLKVLAHVIQARARAIVIIRLGIQI